ncbi:MAG TPA: nucleotide kinase domain-containing protein [Fimbriimonas sp.]|nr:nucleotide kinase domain-containing protein [Fimbriimonas sp.]
MENAEVVENESSIDFALDMIERRIRDVSEPIKSENRDRPDTASANSVRIIRRFAPAIPTIVMETYWRFAAKRQEIFFQRLAGGPQPWSDDPILSKYKFTNAYRASDRVSQYLIRNVIYKSDRPSEPREVLFRILLFKIFNKIETWCLLESKLGELCWESFDFLAYDKVLKEAMDKGTRIYSAAYIMPPGGSAFGYVTKHQNHLALIERMIKDDLALKLQHSTRMQDGFELFTSYPTIGDFLGYQLITDVNYSELTNYSEMEFVVPGPGAKDGLRKAFADLGGLTEAELIRYVADYQDECFAALGLEFKDLFGRKLQLIDCQNLFCEVDKYSRQAHPQISGITGRTRIKQLFTPNSNPMEVWFPPKWKINDKLGETLTLGSGGLL